MADLDQVSHAIGVLTGEVRGLKEQVESFEGTLSPRLSTFEDRLSRVEKGRTTERGMLIGGSAVAGALGGSAAPGFIKALLLKLGMQ